MTIATVSCLLAFALLLAMRWAHRSWGKALLATLFAPLVLVPVGFLVWMLVGLVFRGIADLLGIAAAQVELSSAVVAGLLVVCGLLRYCHEQRKLANFQTGPWLGVRYHVSAPNIGRKSRPR